MICLLDTSAVLIHHRRESEWTRVHEFFERGDDEVLIASVSLAEMGRRLRELGASQDEARSVIDRYRRAAAAVVSIDAEVAMRAAELTWRMPQRLPLVDALIAASAWVHGAHLVHRDHHMRAIPAELLTQIDLEAPATA